MPAHHRKSPWTAIAATAIFAGIAGGLFGWFVRGNFTAPWVAAAGSWVGALGTIGAILWAAHTFRLEQKTEARKQTNERTEAARRQLQDASQVVFSCYGGGGYGGNMMQNVHLEVVNGAKDSIVLTHTWVDGAVFKAEPFDVNRMVTPGETWKVLVDLKEPIEVDSRELGRRPLRTRQSSITYRLDGNTWKTTPGGEPVRIS